MKLKKIFIIFRWLVIVKVILLSFNIKAIQAAGGDDTVNDLEKLKRKIDASKSQSVSQSNKKSHQQNKLINSNNPKLSLTKEVVSNDHSEVAFVEKAMDELHESLFGTDLAENCRKIVSNLSEIRDLKGQLTVALKKLRHVENEKEKSDKNKRSKRDGDSKVHHADAGSQSKKKKGDV